MKIIYFLSFTLLNTMILYGQTSGDFRSKQTGLWSASTTWETFNGTSWINATSSPTSASGVISVLNSHVVTINASVSVDQTIIMDGGKVILSGGTLTINNGLGDDFLISGTYERTSPTTSMTLNGGAAVICSNTGIYIHNSTGLTIPNITWQDGSLLNIKNSVTSNLNQSFWNVLIEGGAATSLSSDNTSRTMTVRNKFEQTGGGFYLKNGGTTGGTHTLDVNGSLVHSGGVFGWNGSNNQGETITNIYVGGDYTISGNASWGGFVSLNNCLAGIFFDGNGEQTFSTVLSHDGAVSNRFYIKSGHLGVHEIYNGTIQQTSISGTCSVTPPTGFLSWPTSGSALKSFTINNSSGTQFQLRHSRNIDQNFYRTNGSIELLNNSVISYNVGNVGNLGASLHYNGSAAITTESPEFPIANGPTNLVVNNAAGVTLHADRTLLGNLEFVQGILNTGSCNSSTNNIMLILGSSSTVVNAGQGKFVNGILRKIGNTAFTFTIGGGGYYAPISISAPSNPADHFTACYVNGDANIQGFNRNSREAGLGTISPCEYWNINRTNGNSNVTVTLGWDDQRGCSLLNTLSQLNVARWNGTIWENRGNNSQQGIVSSGFVTSTVNNNFGSFAISTKSIDLYASAVWIEDCLTPGNGQFFNTSGTGIDLINQDQNNTFEQDFGIHQQNSNSLVLRGAEIKTYKNNSSNVCPPRLNYRVFESNATPGNFIPLPLSFFSNCNGTNFVNGGGPCVQGQQKWQSVVAAGNSSPFSPVNLTNLPPGNYTLQVYYDMNGSNTFTNACSESFVYNNNGNYYNATFTIILPSITVNQPDTCNAFGSIEVTDLVANTVFNVTYLKNGVATDTIAYTTSANGEITIDSLTIGGYSEVTFLINGCEIKSPETFSLINPTLNPNFNLTQVLCENSSAPLLEVTSINGITGTWTPSFIDTNTPGTFSYTFSPNAGQCAVDTTISVTITDKILTLFDSIPTICQYSAAPLLNGISNNGITGTWNPAIIDTISTGATTYIFTPDGNQCAANDSMIVTVDSLITPEFSPISNLCQNTTAPLLPGTSNNGISGSWEPSVIDMNNSGSSIYTFTPSEEHCNAETTINIIVDPQITPIFSAIPDICENSNAPVLPTNSNNGITGTWTPSTIDSSIIGSTNYFFLPSVGQCATSSSLTVTVLSKIIPLFDSIPTICQYSAAPLLNGISNNGVTGEWFPAIINTEVTGIVTYEFTPGSELCATNSILTINILSEDDAICNLDIEIPEAFTPDDDNLNDFFEIKGIQNYSSNQLTIYNRWGNEVYFESGYKNEWDGTANRGLIVGDEKLPTSTYYYILDLYGDGKTTYKGYVFLKR